MSNCFFYAFRRWRREGGYLIVAGSDWGWFWHFGWTAGFGQPVYAFVPDAEHRRYRLIPPLLFRGHEKVIHA